MFHIMVLKSSILCVMWTSTVFVNRWQYSDVSSSLVDWHKMLITQEWFLGSWCLICLYSWHEILFFQTMQICHKSFTFVSNCYILSAQLPSCWLLYVLLLSMPISHQISYLYPLLTVQISTGRMDLLLLQTNPVDVRRKLLGFLY